MQRQSIVSGLEPFVGTSRRADQDGHSEVQKLDGEWTLTLRSLQPSFSERRRDKRDWKQRSQDRTKGLSESIEPELVDFQITEPHTRNESFQADVDSERRDTGERFYRVHGSIGED